MTDVIKIDTNLEFLWWIGLLEYHVHYHAKHIEFVHCFWSMFDLRYTWSNLIIHSRSIAVCMLRLFLACNFFFSHHHAVKGTSPDCNCFFVSEGQGGLGIFERILLNDRRLHYLSMMQAMCMKSERICRTVNCSVGLDSLHFSQSAFQGYNNHNALIL